MDARDEPTTPVSAITQRRRRRVLSMRSRDGCVFATHTSLRPRAAPRDGCVVARGRGREPRRGRGRGRRGRAPRAAQHVPAHDPQHQAAHRARRGARARGGTRTHTRRRVSVMDELRAVAKEDGGLAGLYRGIEPAVIGTVTSQTVYNYVYASLRVATARMKNKGVREKNSSRRRGPRRAGVARDRLRRGLDQRRADDPDLDGVRAHAGRARERGGGEGVFAEKGGARRRTRRKNDDDEKNDGVFSRTLRALKKKRAPRRVVRRVRLISCFRKRARRRCGRARTTRKEEDVSGDHGRGVGGERPRGVLARRGAVADHGEQPRVAVRVLRKRERRVPAAAREDPERGRGFEPERNARSAHRVGGVRRRVAREDGRHGPDVPGAPREDPAAGERVPRREKPKTTFARERLRTTARSTRCAASRARRAWRRSTAGWARR